MCFTGKTLATARCELCFALTHTTTQCGLQSDADPELPARIKTIKSAVIALTANQGKSNGPIRASAEPCCLRNNNRCNFPRCKHEHVCIKCWGNHQAIICPNSYRYRGLQGAQAGASSPMQHRNPYWTLNKDDVLHNPILNYSCIIMDVGINLSVWCYSMHVCYQWEWFRFWGQTSFWDHAHTCIYPKDNIIDSQYHNNARMYDNEQWDHNCA